MKHFIIKLITAIVSLAVLFCLFVPISVSASWTEYSSWGAWSNWQDSVVYETDLCDVETRQVEASRTYKTIYHYYRYANASGTAGDYYQSSSYPNWEEYYLDAPLTEPSFSGGYKYWYNGVNYRTVWACADNGSQVVDTINYKTQYRYRTRSLIYYYTVSYNANGGTGAPSSQTKTGGKTLTLSSTVPTKKYTITYNANGGDVANSSKTVNCTFNNWKASNGTIYNKGASYTANADTTMTAQWYNPTAGTLETPTRTGYTFNGWFTASTGGSQITSSSTISKNITLYAQWTANKFYVKYNGNGSSSGTMSNSAHTYDTSKNLTTNSFVRIGYLFKEWSTNSDGSGTNYSDTESVKNLSALNDNVVELYAQWTPNTYIIKYDGNGHTAGTMTDSTHTYDVSSKLSSNAYTKSRYVFNGWNTKPDGTGTSYSDSQSIKNLTDVNNATYTLYAQWSLNEYTVSFDANGGTNAPENQSKIRNEDLTLTKAVPEKTYTIRYNLNVNSNTASYPEETIESQTVQSTFSRWNTSADGTGTDFLPGGIYKENSPLKLYARWSGAKEIILPAPSRKGYNFTGWYGTYDKIDDTVDGNPSDISGVFNNPANIYGDLTLKAQWSAKEYVVSFDANGGLCETDVKTVVFDSVFGQLPTPTKPGHSFIGWFTSKDSGTQITAESKVNNSSNLTLYARWTPKEVSSIDIDLVQTKTVYYVGDNFDSSQVVVIVTYDDGEKQKINSNFSCSKPTLNKIAKKRVTVTYKEFTAYFIIDIVNAPLTTIEITQIPQKTIYNVGEEIDATGLILELIYSNGHRKEITTGYKLNYDFSISGERKVEVSYKEGDVTATDYFIVTVNESPRIYSNATNFSNEDNISVPIYISNNTGIMGFGIEVTYDNTALIPTSVNPSSLLRGSFNNSISTSNDNTFKIFWAGTENFTENGLLFTLNFNVINNSVGNYTIKLNYLPSDTFNEEWENVILACNNIPITITGDEDDATKIFISNSSTKTGEEFNLPIEIINNSTLDKATISLSYNNTAFKPVLITDGSALVTNYSIDEETGTIIIELEQIPIISSSEVLCIVKFVVLYCKTDNYTFTLNSDEVECIDANINVSEGPAAIYAKKIEFVDNKVYIPINIIGNKGIMGFRINFKYDPKILKPISVSLGSLITSGMSENTLSHSQSNDFSVIWIGTDDILSDGEILVLEFEVLKELTEETTITIDYVQMDTYNSLWQDVVLSCENIVVKKCKIGDMNEDGFVNALDIVVLRKTLLGINEVAENDFYIYDTNGDKEINIIDLVRLKKFLAGVDIPLGTSEQSQTSTVELLSQPAYLEQKNTIA